MLSLKSFAVVIFWMNSRSLRALGNMACNMASQSLDTGDRPMRQASRKSRAPSWTETLLRTAYMAKSLSKITYKSVES